MAASGWVLVFQRLFVVICFELFKLVVHAGQAILWRLSGTAQRVRESYRPENYDRCAQVRPLCSMGVGDCFVKATGSGEVIISLLVLLVGPLCPPVRPSCPGKFDRWMQVVENGVPAGEIVVLAGERDGCVFRRIRSVCSGELPSPSMSLQAVNKCVLQVSDTDNHRSENRAAPMTEPVVRTWYGVPTRYTTKAANGARVATR